MRNICLLSVIAVFTAISTGNAAATVFCQPADIQAYFDQQDGQFTGMSQRGALLVMRNTGKHACQLAALPEVTFSGKRDDGSAATAQRRLSRALLPGPVLLPVTLAPARQQKFLIRWVSGEVFDDSNNCITTSKAVILLSGQPLSLPTHFHMCAAKNSSAFFTLGAVTP